MKKLILVVNNLRYQMKLNLYVIAQLIVSAIYILVCLNMNFEGIDIVNTVKSLNMDNCFIMEQYSKGEEDALVEELKSRDDITAVGDFYSASLEVDKYNNRKIDIINSEFLENTYAHLVEDYDVTELREDTLDEKTVPVIMGQYYAGRYKVGQSIACSSRTRNVYFNMKIVAFFKDNSFNIDSTSYNVKVNNASIYVIDNFNRLKNLKVWERPRYLLFTKDGSDVNVIEDELKDAYYQDYKIMNMNKFYLDMEAENKEQGGRNVFSLIIVLTIAFSGIVGLFELLNISQAKSYGIYYLCGMKWAESVKLISLQNVIINMLPMVAAYFLGVFVVDTLEIIVKPQLLVLTVVALAVLIYLLTCIPFIFNAIFNKSVTKIIEEIRKD